MSPKKVIKNIINGASHIFPEIKLTKYEDISFRNDQENLKGDWVAIGNDMREAISNYSHDQEKEIQLK